MYINTSMISKCRIYTSLVLAHIISASFGHGRLQHDPTTGVGAGSGTNDLGAISTWHPPDNGCLRTQEGTSRSMSKKPMAASSHGGEASLPPFSCCTSGQKSFWAGKPVLLAWLSILTGSLQPRSEACFSCGCCRLQDFFSRKHALLARPLFLLTVTSI